MDGDWILTSYSSVTSERGTGSVNKLLVSFSCNNSNVFLKRIRKGVSWTSRANCCILICNKQNRRESQHGMPGRLCRQKDVLKQALDRPVPFLSSASLACVSTLPAGVPAPGHAEAFAKTLTVPSTSSFCP